MSNIHFQLFPSSITFSSDVCVTLPPSPSHTFDQFHFFTAGDQLVVPGGGVTHISCHDKNTIEGAGENRRTNEQTLGVDSRAKRGVMQHYISDSIYGLAKIPQSYWNADSSSLTVAGPYPMLPRLSARVFTVDRLCPCSVANSRQLLSNQLSSRVPLPLPDTARFQVQKPFVWFRAKTVKGIVCLAGHLYSVTCV